jgi:uncharacterized protein YhaN
VRLTSFHIDGFGALAEFTEEAMAPGLVVVLGPNEAGKSTLFDFLSGVLFGFPNRRDNVRFRAPVRGGRHGGRVGFVDDAGGQFEVERHAGTHRGLVVRLPDGSEGDEHSLSRALAGASASLFEAVFAVGLDDLGQMKNLQSDEVRELLFAASIFGQRRSATRAMKHLGDLRDELARPRREDAIANRLAARLEEVRAELAAVRLETRTFDEVQRQAMLIADDLGALRSRLKELRARERELQLLLGCWQQYTRARSLRNELASLPLTTTELTLLEHGALLRELAQERSGHVERIEKLEELRRSKASLEASIDRRLSQIGQTWTRELAAEAPDPQILLESVRSARDRIDVLKVQLVSAQAVVAHAQSVLSAIPDDHDVVDDVPGRTELEQQQSALSELRERTSEAEVLEMAAVAEERSRAPGTGIAGPARTAARPAVVALVLAGMAVCLLGAGLLARGQGSFAALTAIVGALLVGGGAIIWRSDRPQDSDALADGQAVDRDAAAARAAADRAVVLARTMSRIEELACELGLTLPLMRLDLDRFGAALQRQWERRRQIDDLAANREQAAARVTAAAEGARLALSALTREQEEHQTWCTAHGFASAEPDATLETTAELSEVRSQLQALGRVDRALDSLEPSVVSFVGRWRRLLAAVAPALDELSRRPAGAIAGALEPSAENAADTACLETVIEGLMGMLQEATGVSAERARLERELASAESALENTLGGGATGDRLRAALVTGDVISWSSEQADLAPQIDDISRAEESAVRRHQSLAEQMRRLATSDRIAELERCEVALEVELDEVLRRYLILGTARALLQRTLTRHERERQPAVVASAAVHFARVTEGRYVRLLASAGMDGKQTLRVVSASGETIDATSLSRGTVEQLYLCLRLGLADFFAERSVALPILLDDVLVNFDPERARAVAAELAESSRSHQIVLFTCHPHLAAMVLRAGRHLQAEAQLIQLDRLGDPGSKVEQLALAALAALPDLPEHEAAGVAAAPNDASEAGAAGAAGDSREDDVAGGGPVLRTAAGDTPFP